MPSIPVSRALSPEEHVPHELEHDTNAVMRWTTGLLFSGALAAVQSWYRRRQSEKRFAEQAAVLKQELAPEPEPGNKPDDLRDILSDVQRAIALQSRVQDERHAANITRFSGIEAQQADVRADLRQGRTEVEGLRAETREQTQMMQRILTEVVAVRQQR